MKREHLEHLIRAASAVTNCYELVVVGSQSILGAYPNAPEDLLYSQEADLFPLEAPFLSDLIDPGCLPAQTRSFRGGIAGRGYRRWSSMYWRTMSIGAPPQLAAK